MLRLLVAESWAKAYVAAAANSWLLENETSLSINPEASGEATGLAPGVASVMR